MLRLRFSVCYFLDSELTYKFWNTPCSCFVFRSVCSASFSLKKVASCRWQAGLGHDPAADMILILRSGNGLFPGLGTESGQFPTSSQPLLLHDLLYSRKCIRWRKLGRVVTDQNSIPGSVMRLLSYYYYSSPPHRTASGALTASPPMRSGESFSQE